MTDRTPAENAATDSEGRGTREHLSSAQAAAPPGPEVTPADHAATVRLGIAAQDALSEFDRAVLAAREEQK